MAGICIQCALEAFVASAGDGPVPRGDFDGTPEEHMRLVHPNGVDPVKRRELEQRAGEILCRISGTP